MVLKINKRRWGRGDTGGYLRDSNGKQCCLGFLSRACGFSPDEITNEGMISSLSCEGHPAAEKIPPRLFKGINQNCTNLETKLAEINDNPETSDEFKEKEITRLMKLMGVNVTFFYS